MMMLITAMNVNILNPTLQVVTMETVS
jgi:hypothetical protein